VFQLPPIAIPPLTTGPISLGGSGTLGGAPDAISVADAALAQLAAARGKVGAEVSGLEVAVSRAYDGELQHAAAVSQIMHADLGTEMTALLPARILRQAGLAVVAQANVLASAALRLVQPPALAAL
jgi:flagellin-like hook-associated protein FlgL